MRNGGLENAEPGRGAIQELLNLDWIGFGFKFGTFLIIFVTALVVENKSCFDSLFFLFSCLYFTTFGHLS